MKLAVQLNLLPGGNTADKVKWAADHGVEGIELTVFGDKGHDALRQQAAEIGGRVPISTVCGNATPDGRRAFDFLNPDPKLRRESIDSCKALLEICGEMGAVGQVVPPIFGPPVVPDLSPVISIPELEDALMVEACKEIGPVAQEHGTLLLLEPLNRYEQHYLRKQSDGVRVIEAAGAPGVELISDLFHMNIEELDTPATIRDVAKHIKHVHLADNTRLEPGTGCIDFVGAFKALAEVGYDGYMAYECGISGDSPDAKAKNLAKSLDHLRDCIAKARG